MASTTMPGSCGPVRASWGASGRAALALLSSAVEGLAVYRDIHRGARVADTALGRVGITREQADFIAAQARRFLDR